MDNAKSAIDTHAPIEFCDSSLKAAQDADALIVVTEWDEFR